jgi:hypothetical protein
MNKRSSRSTGSTFILYVAIPLFVVAILFLGYVGGPGLFSYTYSSVEKDTEHSVLVEQEEEPVRAPKVIHLPTPDVVKGVYMTQCVVGTPSFRDKIVALVEATELNSIIIDIKDFSGGISFPTDNPKLAPYVSEACGAFDMKSFIERLHAKGIYVIGRITVFQDPLYSKQHPELAVKKASDTSIVWTDYKGLPFIDVGARPFWEYIVELSRESYDIGFDELNYDYVRYPSDGNMKDIAFTHSEGKPKADVLELFFAYLYDKLSGPWEDNEDVPALSVDLFGYTTTNRDDLGIGQLLERALPYFNFVMPMVYPSHYNSGFIGIAKPATAPYEVVKYSMEESVRRVRALADAKGSTATTSEAEYLRTQAYKGHGNIHVQQMRPWLQDFDLGAIYTPDMVRAQIQATYDAGLTSWALWDAGNTYTQAALRNDTVTLTPSEQ